MAKQVAGNGGTGVDFESLAGELLNFWKNDPASAATLNRTGEGVGPADIVSVLTKLSSSGLLDSAILAAIGSPAAKVQFAISAIRTFQGLAKVKQDGVLGRITRKFSDSFSGCNDKQTSTTPTDGLAKAAAGLPMLFYTLEDSFREFKVPNGRSTKAIVAEATHAWAQHIDCAFVFVEDKKDANIVLQFGGDSSFGRAGGVLGVGTLGGPNINMQLELKLDKAEPWDEDSLTTTIIHELGHNLGIVHPAGTGFLMSAFKDPTIKLPTRHDIELAQALWGAPKHRPLSVG